MSKYTTTIKTLMDNNFNFGLQEYPIFDEEYRSILNKKILNHYYEEEIGFETANLFKFYLNNRMDEIMPKYNLLYEVEKEMIDNNLWLNDTNLTETLSGQDSSNLTNNTINSSSSTINDTTTNKNLFQDTPQGSLDTTSLENQRWATNVTFDNGTGTTTYSDNGTTNNSQTASGTNSYVKKIIGNRGRRYNIEILKEIEDEFKDIDTMIIDELFDLFMGLY